MSTLSRAAFDGTAGLMSEAIRRVLECDMPDEETRLAQVVFLCDALKSSALGRCSELAYLASKAKP